MKNSSLLAVMALALGITIIGCGDPNDEINGTTVTVYAAGRIETFENGDWVNKAYYWRGTQKTALSGSNASVITVVNGVAYTAGVDDDRNACFWTGTTRTNITGVEGEPWAIFATGGIVYTAGLNSIDFTSTPYFSVGSTPTFNQDADALVGIAAAGGIVYTIEGSYPRYYENTTLRNLEVPADALNTRLNAITVVNGVVYTVGFYAILDETDPENPLYMEIPSFWTGSVRTELSVPPGTGEARPAAIYVSGGIVYTAGKYEDSEYEEHPCYWIGEERFDLPLPQDARFFRISAITVVDSTVYTAGYYHDEDSNANLIYWKDTTYVKAGNLGDVRITDVFIEVK